MNILILGCGPAGLMAAHAAVLEGNDVVIASNKRKSHLFGCQYLHAPIPGMTDQPAVTVEYRLQGDVDGYREKVYGPGSSVDVSPETLRGFHPAWDIRSTYDNLWDAYSEYVQELNLDAATLAVVLNTWKPDFTVSTIPLPRLCSAGHAFSHETVWAIGDGPDQVCPISMPKNTVVCNGEVDYAWYRAANVFGYKTAEWPERRKPPFGRPAAVQKPTTTTCNCYPEVQRLGRYGAWKKGVLSHEAFFTMQSMLRGEHAEVSA